MLSIGRHPAHLMLRFTSRIYPAVSLVLFTAMPIASQSNNYHTELTEDSPRQIILVNDSYKPIEAFHVLRCDDFPLGSDSLQIWDDPLPDKLRLSATKVLSIDVPVFRTVGEPAPDSLVAGPEGGRVISGIPIADSCQEPNIDAVIFSDGTYDGDDEIVQEMQIFREGLSDGVSFWNAEFDQSGTDHDTGTILTNAKSLTLRDQRQRNKYWAKERLYSAYWSGRYSVDDLIILNPQLTFDQLASAFKRWRARIDSDVAMEKLAKEFPLPSSFPLVHDTER